ncbi:craniofacial development protein 2-like [Mytilus edulis]|uniref:craniofacial development protein 2-like n=1 Tax=Mytilus edulis TaxID=6550 RepID=UPI0039EF1DA1
MITETQDTLRNQHEDNTSAAQHGSRDMTLVDESPWEVHKLTPLCTPKDNILLGSWNVRTMYATGKTAEVEREMDRYNIEILALNEVRWLDSGKLTLQNGKVLLYSGRNDGLHQAGVGMMLSNRAKKALIEWKPITERLMYARFHTTTIKISVITVYAPTNDATDETKESFIEQLDRVIAGTPKHDILLVMGDFNAKVGINNEGHESIMGRHGIGRRNENGENLLDICQRNNLVITGTIFPHKDKHKITWISPNKKTENQIDHILVTRQHRTSILDTRAMRGADIGSDHELLKC